ncbi:ribosome maturation factor RimM [Corynebacterium sp. CCUG 51687]|uniref:ribosome maturation factor RimM n=1 Tax=Corynebacterium sp. CCUG 51687 TaxID=2823897 RepID=UPI00351E50D4
MSMELLIGRVVKTHGIKGEVAVEVHTDQPEVRFAVGSKLRGAQTGKDIELTVATARPHKGRLLLSFEEVPDRTAAEGLRGLKFFATPLERGEDADPDEFYDHELIGLNVRLDGEEIGQVTGVMHTPGRQILEVEYDGREVLVPFVSDIVPEVDLEKGFLSITPPEGLLNV